MRTIALLALLIVCVPFAQSMGTDVAVSAPRPVIELTSMAWPPYSGATLPDQGSSVAVVRGALAAMGYALRVRFYPSQRAVALAKSADSRYLGFVPTYATPLIAATFWLSKPIGHSELGFVERSDAPVTWTTLGDLHGLSIGVVRGYTNTTEFDARVADRRLLVEPAIDDLTNLRKLASGRVRLAVMDAAVMRYLLATEPSLIEARDMLRFNPRPLAVKPIHVAIRHGEQNRALLDALDSGLDRIDADAVQAAYIQRVMSGASRYIEPYDRQR